MSQTTLLAAYVQPGSLQPLGKAESNPFEGSTRKSLDNGGVVPGPSKEWVLPPRAKPGRKPITDQPPTRRKAQNRAAQRAFRERRAARVGELEEELREKEAAHNAELQEVKTAFENERQHYLQNVAQWRERAGHWEQQAHNSYEEIASLRRRIDQMTISSWSSVSSATGTSSLPTPTTSVDHILPPTFSLPPINEPQAPATPSYQNIPSLSECITCGANGRCPCIDKILNDIPQEPRQSDFDISHDSLQSKKDPPSYDELETDFTARFAKTSTKDTLMSDPDLSDTVENDLNSSSHCGFCTDATNCICEQNEMEVATSTTRNVVNEGQAERYTPSLMLPSKNIEGKHKPPIMEPSVKLTGPGTCPSCLADPDQRRFCQQLAGILPPPPLANKRDTTSKDVLEFPFPHEVNLNKENNKERISCADAYSKLRQDPNFDSSRADFNIFKNLSGGHSCGSPDCKNCKKAGSSAFEVDCASILTAMKTSGKNYSQMSSRQHDENDRDHEEHSK